LVEAVKKVLSDPKFLKNTRRFQKIMSKYDAPWTGARLIENLLQAKKNGRKNL
jgi:UDP:flavonoid glycosyltransferase YjiC (YdhE family)